MKHLDLGDAKYIRVDIVRDMIEENLRKYGNGMRGLSESDVCSLVAAMASVV
jgi:hypothetical protein